MTEQEQVEYLKQENARLKEQIKNQSYLLTFAQGAIQSVINRAIAERQELENELAKYKTTDTLITKANRMMEIR